MAVNVDLSGPKLATSVLRIIRPQFGNKPVHLRFSSQAGRRGRTGDLSAGGHTRLLPRALPASIYFTMNVAVALCVNDPETPVKVMVYVPGGVVVGNRIPDIAYAVPFTCTVCGKSAHFDPAGPPEQLTVTLPLKPFTDFSTRRNAARRPR